MGCQLQCSARQRSRLSAVPPLCSGAAAIRQPVDSRIGGVPNNLLVFALVGVLRIGGARW
ncbi:MAG: hypothetical protein J7539_03790 [Niabella sp.]|nr:hypothetical protein [Niabella sp.]